MTVIPLDGGKPWAVFEKQELIEGGIHGFYGVRQRDGKWYGFFGGLTLDVASRTGQTYRTTASPVLYEVDLQNHATRRIASRTEDQADRREWLMGPDGKVSVKLDNIATTGSWWIDTAQKSHVALGTQRKGGVKLIGFGSTDRKSTRLNSSHLRLSRMPSSA